MHFKNDTSDQIRLIQRKHQFGDEPNANYRLLPGESCDIPGGGTYEAFDHGYHPMTSEDATVLAERAAAGINASRPAPIAGAELSEQERMERHVAMEREAAAANKMTDEGSPASDPVPLDPELGDPSVDAVETPPVDEQKGQAAAQERIAPLDEKNPQVQTA